MGASGTVSKPSVSELYGSECERVLRDEARRGDLCLLEMIVVCGRSHLTPEER